MSNCLFAPGPCPWQEGRSGPRILVIENISRGARFFGEKSYLVFDANLTHFIGFDFNGRTTVEGFRREAVDPKRQPPEAKDE